MNTTGPRGFPPSWSTIRSTEETVLQEICWLLLNYCRYRRYTVAVINLYILQSWVYCQSMLGLSIHKCCLNSTDADRSFSIPSTCTWFLIFLCDFSFHFSIILYPIFLLYSYMATLTDSLWWWGDKEGSYCCPWLCCTSDQGAINKKYVPLFNSTSFSILV